MSSWQQRLLERAALEEDKAAGHACRGHSAEHREQAKLARDLAAVMGDMEPLATPERPR